MQVQLQSCLLRILSGLFGGGIRAFCWGGLVQRGQAVPIERAYTIDSRGLAATKISVAVIHFGLSACCAP
jgi:hypothetical protein